MNNRIMTRFGVLFLLVFVVVLIASGAAAEVTGTFGDNITWTFDDSGVLTIEGTGELTGVELNQMDWEYQMKEAVVRPGVTAIGGRVFCYCRKLERITLPDTLKTIGYNAFEWCEGLESIVIPDSVTRIESAAFSGCRSLKSVTLPSGLTAIDDRLFSQCAGLTEVRIPAGVNSIGGDAFAGCASLKSIEIPSGVTVIEDRTFIGSGLETLAIPRGVSGIGSFAFSSCGHLVSVYIPDTVKQIGSNAFEGCVRLAGIDLPYGLKTIESSTFRGCSSLGAVSIPQGVEKIGDYAFERCAGLWSVAIPEGVTYIGDHTFAECVSLVSASIPDSVIEINDLAFASCFSLQEAALPNGLKFLGEAAFADCYSLKTVTVPGTVEDIREAAFNACASLKEVVIRDGVKYIGERAFLNCVKLQYLTVPASVKNIGEYAFEYCDALKKITVVRGSYADKTFTAMKGKAGLLDRVAQITVSVSAAVFPDKAFRNYVSTVIDKDGNGRLTPGEIAAVKEIDLSGVKKAASLKGIELFTELERLNVDDNRLTRLDLKQNTKLKTLSCRNNQLTWLDLSKNKALETLNCEGNLRKVTALGGWFDLREIDGFNILKAEGFSGAERESDLLLALKPGKVTYTYDCGRGFKAAFTLQLSAARKLKITGLKLDQAQYDYTGKAVVPGVTVTADVSGGAIALREGQYKITCSKNVKRGIATVTVTGKGFYTGTLKAKFKIVKALLGAVALEYDRAAYTGEALKPKVTVTVTSGGEPVTLKEGTDYRVKYRDNTVPGTAAVTVTGKGNYTGTLEAAFEIDRAELSSVKLKYTKTKYTGSPLKPGVTVKGNGTALIRDTDYTVTYENNVDAGTASVIVEGVGFYQGTLTKTFRITPVKILKVELSKYELPYNGKARKPVPTVTAKAGGKIVTLEKDRDYTVEYENNKQPGTATVTITGKGNYTGTITMNFTILANEKK